MAMTVRRLITVLKKLPQNAQVCVCAHDQNPEQGEFDGGVFSVDVAPPAIKERGYGVVIQLG